jgi:peptide/nickel transport system permease protein
MRLLEGIPWITKYRFVIIGGGVLLFFFLSSLLGPWVVPYQPGESDLPYLPITDKHPLGTNDMGYDIFSEWICAGRYSITIGILAALMSVIIGGGIGILAGYFRGLWGEFFTGIIDVFLLIPMLPLMVVLAAYLGQGWSNIVLAISLLGWCSTARAVRAKVLQLREALFVEALKVLGISSGRILVSHMAPHVMEIISAKFILTVAYAMLSEAALSFIGLGDPSAVSWGTMVHYAFQRGGFASGMWYWYLPPGLSIGFCALGFMLIGMHFESSSRTPTGYAWFGGKIFEHR